MLIKRFKQVVSPHLVGPVPQTPWDWIFLMQHHGAPTRLLDWTESPLVGLYFAIVKDAETDAALWCLDPISLNEASKIKYNFELELPAFEADDKILQNYLPERLDPVIELLPIAVIGQRNSPRMIAQSGTFTINHLKNISIDQIGTQKHIWRYIIPKESRKTIREELRLLGYSELKIFPGLDVAGRSVAKELC